MVHRGFRQRVLRLLVELLEAAPRPNYPSICLCLMTLGESAEVAKILFRLLRGSEEEELVAYQIAFDLVDNEVQLFLAQVRERLAAAVEVRRLNLLPPGKRALSELVLNAGTSPLEQAEAAAADAPAAAEGAPAAPSPLQERYGRLVKVLSGEATVSAHFEFLYSRNSSDLALLKNIKGSFDAKNSVLHGATVLANALMHCGTTSDSFLRDNLDWLARASNWAKFSATSSLGVIHRGHLSRSRQLMAPYLPGAGRNAGPYAEGGALFALGLIHANHGEGIRQTLLESLRGTTNETIQHGACLGLGLAAMGSFDDELLEDIKNVLFTDSAVAGEAAGIAMGLVLVGSASEKAQEMLAYAHETQHEKIIRGLALGSALTMFGREEQADTLVETMTRDQDGILRYGGLFTLGLAYAGTSNNAAIQKLLHFAVSDVSDDVRRAAVMMLGFVLCNNPEQCPPIVALLAQSYNPHVR